LQKIYQTDTLFVVQKKPKRAIEAEKKRIHREDQRFLDELNVLTYVSWYLPVRKLVSSVGMVAQYRTEELPATIEAFRALNYTDARMYKSGLLRDALKAYVWLIENSGRPLDSVYVELNKSIDRMMPSLIADERKFNEITDYLFKLLEKRSLFGTSEYLALKVLNEKSCTLNNDLAAQLESYRAMKKGNVAPDILFEGELLMPTTVANTSAPKTAKKLSDLHSRFTVVVFGASWCPACTTELLHIAGLYSNWKQQGVEVLFISLDDTPEAFRQFAAHFPFVSFCDYKKWESEAVGDYHVFATPTLYLLDANRKIILRPTSARQLDAWVDWFLVQGK
jgi:thiol-disulfide isomerase/thioredoxin